MLDSAEVLRALVTERARGNFSRALKQTVEPGDRCQPGGEERMNGSTGKRNRYSQLTTNKCGYKGEKREREKYQVEGR